MKTINTIDDAIKMLRENIPYLEPDEDLMQIAEWLEELKTLRVEIEVYKKALEMACVALEERTLPTAYFHRNNFLKKAREQTDGTR